MKKFFVGLLVGFLYVALLIGTFYKGVSDECISRGFNSAFISPAGSLCINSKDIDKNDFRVTVGSF